MFGHLFAFETIGSEPRLRLLPVMITRLMLSLKKAASSHEHGWSLGKPTTHTTIRFAERRGDISTGDEIRLDTFGGTHEATQVKSDGV